MKFYFAGKITKNGWRESILGNRGGSAEADIGGSGKFVGEWETVRIPDTEHLYVGPFFISCDHGGFHGDGSHGAGAFGEAHRLCCAELGEDRLEVVRRCLAAVYACDIVFAWLEPGAYGTVTEIGYAKAYGKKIFVAFEDNMPFQGRPHEMQQAERSGVSDLWFASALADVTFQAENPKAAFYKVLDLIDGPSLDKCQSPIEKSYLSALMHKDLRGFRIKQQYEIDNGRYYLDFALFHSDGRKVCVECDGHDYHERTKEQAQRDRERDRFLTLRDWRVLRFTGSEIYRNVEKCVGETLEHLRRVSR